MTDNIRIGIDLGGTKIEAIAIEKTGEILTRMRIQTPRGEYLETIKAIGDLVHSLESNLNRTGSVGIGIPGCVSKKTGLIKGANSTWLIGKALELDLSNALKRPVRLANDANCFALSEAVDGNGKGYDTVFGVILGTGVGGGICIGARPLNGLNGISGEWGHNYLFDSPDPESKNAGSTLFTPLPSCYCGRQGCIESYLSGPALEAQYFALTGIKESATHIAEIADSGNTIALNLMEQYENRLAWGLGSIVNILDPDIIILGGGLSKIERLYTNVPKLLKKYVFSDYVDTIISPPSHGDSSGVRGAAWLWADGEYSDTLQHLENKYE